MVSQERSYAGPSWDNYTEYKDFSSSELVQDQKRCAQIIEEIIEKSSLLAADIEAWSQGDMRAALEQSTSAAIWLSQKKSEARILIGNLSTYAQCALSVDGGHEAAKTLLGQVQSLQAKANAAFQTHNIWLTLAPEASLEVYFSHEATKADKFFASRLRLKRDNLLSLPEEELLKQLEVHGPTAWGNMYDQISSTLSCKLEVDGKMQEIGLTRTIALLESPDPQTRLNAYRSIQTAWESQEEACAASLNALVGWRLQVYERRSKVRPMHYLDEALHINCIERETLDAMLSSISEYRDIARRGLKQQAKILGLKQLGPWDLFAPYPKEEGAGEQLYSFDEAIELIQEAFLGIHPDMADFVGHMVKERWIEGTIGENKRPGAYCTKFLKSRTPRIYMTYSGGMKDIITLAHELGHAFHNWVMRDLPLAEISYPMTLAETASIISQTIVNRHLMQVAKSQSEKVSVLWTDAREAEAFLLNIPARFDFEKSMYETRREQPLSPRILRQLMSQAWQDWYGDTLVESNEMFWASKLHFHIPNLSFYNFPYSFGYLFSLGVLAQKDRLGKDFFPAYVQLLRDTGRMTAEELAKKHLAVDLRQQNFWQASLELIRNGLLEFYS